MRYAVVMLFPACKLVPTVTLATYGNLQAILSIFSQPLLTNATKTWMKPTINSFYQHSEMTLSLSYRLAWSILLFLLLKVVKTAQKLLCLVSISDDGIRRIANSSLSNSPKYFHVSIFLPPSSWCKQYSMVTFWTKKKVVDLQKLGNGNNKSNVT